MFSSFVKFDKLNFNEVFFTTGITRQSKYGKEINEQQFVQELTSSLGEIWDLEHKIWNITLYKDVACPHFQACCYQQSRK